MRFAALAALGLICLAGTSMASTIHPNNVDSIFTEGGRTTTIGGDDISGNAVASGNPDINRHFIDASPDTDSYLLSGQLDASDMDRWIFRGISGLFSVNLLDYAGSASNGGASFSGDFTVSIDGLVVGSLSLGGTSGQSVSNPFGSFNVDDANILIQATGTSGTSNYDIAVNIATAPLPTSGLLLGAGLFGVGAWMRRCARKA